MTVHCPSCGDSIQSTDHQYIIEYYACGDGNGTFGGEVLCRECFLGILEELTSAYTAAQADGTAENKDWAVHHDLPLVAPNAELQPDLSSDHGSPEPGGETE